MRDSGRFCNTVFGRNGVYFEAAFAHSLGRRYGISVASGTIGLMVSLRALGIGPGDEVIASAYSWHQIAHAIVLVGATPIFADIDYWSGTLAVDKAAEKITPHTRAIVAGNTNGHPAAWEPFRALAKTHGIKLIEDSTEAIGSRYKGQLVGTFGDLSIFDFSHSSSAHECPPPAAIAFALTSPRTGAACGRASVEPSPSCPASFAPQHCTDPSLRRAHAWFRPAARSRTTRHAPLPSHAPPLPQSVPARAARVVAAPASQAGRTHGFSLGAGASVASFCDVASPLASQIDRRQSPAVCPEGAGVPGGNASTTQPPSRQPACRHGPLVTGHSASEVHVGVARTSRASGAGGPAAQPKSNDAMHAK